MAQIVGFTCMHQSSSDKLQLAAFTRIPKRELGKISKSLECLAENHCISNEEVGALRSRLHTRLNSPALSSVKSKSKRIEYKQKARSSPVRQKKHDKNIATFKKYFDDADAVIPSSRNFFARNKALLYGMVISEVVGILTIPGVIKDIHELGTSNHPPFFTVLEMLTQAAPIFLGRLLSRGPKGHFFGEHESPLQHIIAATRDKVILRSAFSESNIEELSKIIPKAVDKIDRNELRQILLVAARACPREYLKPLSYWAIMAATKSEKKEEAPIYDYSFNGKRFGYHFARSIIGRTDFKRASETDTTLVSLAVVGLSLVGGHGVQTWVNAVFNQEKFDNLNQNEKEERIQIAMSAISWADNNETGRFAVLLQTCLQKLESFPEAMQMDLLFRSPVSLVIACFGKPEYQGKIAEFFFRAPWFEAMQPAEKLSLLSNFTKKVCPNSEIEDNLKQKLAQVSAENSLVIPS